jgi:hypothetical protein
LISGEYVFQARVSIGGRSQEAKKPGAAKRR